MAWRRGDVIVAMRRSTENASRGVTSTAWRSLSVHQQHTDAHTHSARVLLVFKLIVVFIVVHFYYSHFHLIFTLPMF